MLCPKQCSFPRLLVGSHFSGDPFSSNLCTYSLTFSLVFFFCLTFLTIEGVLFRALVDLIASDFLLDFLSLSLTVVALLCFVRDLAAANLITVASGFSCSSIWPYKINNINTYCFTNV